jgi:hypothetical protein
MRPKAALSVVCYSRHFSKVVSQNRASSCIGAFRIVPRFGGCLPHSIARPRRFHPIRGEYYPLRASLSDMLIRWVVTGAPMRPGPSFIDSTPERTR